MARSEGIDPQRLISVAERDNAPTQGKNSEIKLFQYHLPFVKVREVRQYLGFTEAFPGDDEVAGDWAMKHGGAPEAGGGGPAGEGDA